MGGLVRLLCRERPAVVNMFHEACTPTQLAASFVCRSLALKAVHQFRGAQGRKKSIGVKAAAFRMWYVIDTVNFNRKGRMWRSKARSSSKQVHHFVPKGIFKSVSSTFAEGCFPFSISSNTFFHHLLFSLSA